jgi:beta-galactosidase/beta-glucuronidase
MNGGPAVITPRGEYPRPQLMRRDFLCLNGEWEFEVDPGDTGEERGLLRRPLEGRINVPFAPEAPLSGIGAVDFLPVVWYRRTVIVPSEWGDAKVRLHFQAVDYEATVWVNGVELARHRGGSTPFSCDLSGVVRPGQEATIVLRARDDPDAVQPRGKQSDQFMPYGSRCPRTTGIWQTVWMEPVPQTYLGRVRVTPNAGLGAFVVEQPVQGERKGIFLRTVLLLNGAEVAGEMVPAWADLTPSVVLALAPASRRLWSPEDPVLFELTMSLVDADGAIVDEATSYAGLRSISAGDGVLLLNGEPRFLRLVLDQGYWPDGGLTAPSEAALVEDIELAKAAGFDGARAHQRVAEERWLYHADRLGYLVWGEFPDWGNKRHGVPAHHLGFSLDYVAEWLAVLERDHSHPCIIGWCALNETEVPAGGSLHDLDAVTQALYLAARASDRTRPVLDVSGYEHRTAGSDVWDCHDYEQEPEVFASHYASLPEVPLELTSDIPGNRGLEPRAGQPVMVSEFGGARLLEADGKAGHGYGEPLASPEALLQRFRALCRSLLDNDRVAGYAYTQLTDTYEERNGLLDARRRPKVPLEELFEAQRQPAASEARVREAQAVRGRQPRPCPPEPLLGESAVLET